MEGGYWCFLVLSLLNILPSFVIRVGYSVPAVIGFIRTWFWFVKKAISCRVLFLTVYVMIFSFFLSLSFNVWSSGGVVGGAVLRFKNLWSFDELKSTMLNSLSHEKGKSKIWLMIIFWIQRFPPWKCFCCWWAQCFPFSWRVFREPIWPLLILRFSVVSLANCWVTIGLRKRGKREVVGMGKGLEKGKQTT